MRGEKYRRIYWITVACLVCIIGILINSITFLNKKAVIAAEEHSTNQQQLAERQEKLDGANWSLADKSREQEETADKLRNC